MAVAVKKDAPKSETESKGKILPDQTKVEVTETVIQTPEAPKAEEQVNWTPEQKKFVDMSQDDLWKFFGGRDARGAVSKAIRYLNALGFTRSKISDMTGKRYQHVRNVLVEDARQKAAADAKAKTVAQSQTK